MIFTPSGKTPSGCNCPGVECAYNVCVEVDDKVPEAFLLHLDSDFTVYAGCVIPAGDYILTYYVPYIGGGCNWLYDFGAPVSGCEGKRYLFIAMTTYGANYTINIYFGYESFITESNIVLCWYKLSASLFPCWTMEEYVVTSQIGGQPDAELTTQ